MERNLHFKEVRTGWVNDAINGDSAAVPSVRFSCFSEKANGAVLLLLCRLDLSTARDWVEE